MDDTDEQIVENEEQLEVEKEPSRVAVPEQLGIALGILILVFGTSFIADIASSVEKDHPTETKTTELDEPEPKEPEKKVFEEIAILGTSAYVWDVREQRALYKKNADEQLPLASITKLMTALVAYEIVDTDDTVDITIEAIEELGDSGLTDGETFALHDLTDFTLITSSNDGASALAAAAGGTLSHDEPYDTFIRAMNIRAEELGLSGTYFNNATGLDIEDDRAGAYGSARDVAFLMEYILTNYPELLERTRDQSVAVENLSGTTHYAENTHENVNDIVGLIGSKTGFTYLAGGNLVIAFDAGLNRPIVVSVLGSSIDGRFGDVRALAEEARRYVTDTP